MEEKDVTHPPASFLLEERVRTGAGSEFGVDHGIGRTSGVRAPFYWHVKR